MGTTLGWKTLALGFALASAACGSAGAVSCTVSGSSLAFGSYNAVSKAEVDTSGSITLTCTGSGSISYTVSLSPGQSGSETARYLASGAQHLTYQVYKDSAHTQVFGDGSGGTYAFSNTWSVPSGTSSRQGAIYAEVPSGQNPAPGSYSDSLTLMVAY